MQNSLLQDSESQRAIKVNSTINLVDTVTTPSISPSSLLSEEIVRPDEKLK